MTTPPAENEMRPCVKCQTEVDDEHFCFGCKESICEGCEADYSVAAAMMGPHDVEDHFTEADFDD